MVFLSHPSRSSPGAHSHPRLPRQSSTTGPVRCYRKTCGCSGARRRKSGNSLRPALGKGRCRNIRAAIVIDGEKKIGSVGRGHRELWFWPRRCFPPVNKEGNSNEVVRVHAKKQGNSPSLFQECFKETAAIATQRLESYLAPSRQTPDWQMPELMCALHHRKDKHNAAGEKVHFRYSLASTVCHTSTTNALSLDPM